MKTLAVRLAKGLNREFRRRGQVFADRYHLHVVTTPREMRNGLDAALRPP